MESKASFENVCREAGTPTRLNSHQARASRICDGSLYIALRLSRPIPTRSLSSSAVLTLIFQEGFGAYSVRFPLFITEKLEVPKRTPSSLGGGMCRLSF